MSLFFLPSTIPIQVNENINYSQTELLHKTSPAKTRIYSNQSTFLRTLSGVLPKKERYRLLRLLLAELCDISRKPLGVAIFCFSKILTRSRRFFFLFSRKFSHTTQNTERRFRNDSDLEWRNTAAISPTILQHLGCPLLFRFLPKCFWN